MRCGRKESTRRTKAFANLREFLQWFADWGEKTRCCQRATDEEIAGDPDRYDCANCELTGRFEGLWVDNAEAWDIFKNLSGRTVGLLEWRGALLSRITDGWPLEDVMILLRRLDLILDVLQPEGRPGHGRT